MAAIGIHPEWPTPYSYIAVHLAGLGRLDESLAWTHKARSLSSDPFIGGNIGVGIWYEFGDLERAKQFLVKLPPGHPFEPINSAIKVLIDGDTQLALQHLDTVIDSDVQVPGFVYNVASDLALLNGDYDKARRYALLEDPILDRDREPVIDRFTVDNVIKLAYIYSQTGNPALARELAQDSLPVIQRLPRLGMYGHGLLDVEAFAILGRNDDALAAFEQAVDDGLRSNFMTNAWPLEMNPYLRSIRDDPRFIALQQRLDGYLQEMHENVIRAKQAGTFDQLRRLASPGVDFQI